LAVRAEEAGRSTWAARRRLSAAFWRRPWLRATALLTPTVGAYVLIYLGALGALFIAAFWALDPFTGELVHTWGFDNFRTLWNEHTYWRIAGRTIGLAAAVTLTDVLIAFPFAYYMARVASPRMRTLLFVLVLLPLWSSYLARIYAWRLILSKDGALNWSLGGLGLPEQHLAYTNWAMWIVFSYIWLPFMILPVYAALERIPESYIEASRDLGAKNWTTLRRVVLPLALPVGNTQFIGNVVYRNVLGLTYNLPFAAAYATVPLVVMAIYLVAARRAGAFEAL
jgi:putative spermidine/putrescine transport system permease protein